MPPSNITRNLFLLNLITVVFLFSVQEALAANNGQQSFETRYAAVYYPDEDALHDFGKKIGGIAFLGRDPERDRASIGATVDRIVFRVETILDMFPNDFHFNVYIYPTYAEIKDIYREKGFIEDSPVAFYSHTSMGIYLAAEKITDRVFAHEIAHAVINSYFLTPPPAGMQEILAQYVDKHLWEK
ncbi:MAG: hypothetical protein HY883_02615 [Deltaproteobacteria bacterium]|nr:hypothetical protein [Deltaproteobacteria bacterium]